MELMTRVESWNITYNHALGEVASWFYAQLRDNAKIYGKRCAKTGHVLVPPRAFSDETLLPTTDWVEVGPGGTSTWPVLAQRAFSDETLLPTTDWVEVGPGGTIQAFTFVYEEFKNLPPPPYAFGYVLLDGADTAIGGYFKGVDLTDPHKAAEKLAIGTRVITRFAEKRTGDVLDFWFELTA